jgi:hypothetical protein
MNDKLSPEHLANAVTNYSEFSDAELQRCADVGNSIAAEVLAARRREPLMRCTKKEYYRRLQEN